MKTKKIALILITIIAIVLVASSFNASYAATTTPSDSKWLNIKALRTSGYGYKALEKTIWKISEVDKDSGTFLNNNKTIYCLRGGPGFGSSDMDNGGTNSIVKKEYTKQFNMKDPDSIIYPYTTAIPNTTTATYKSLVWLLENIYVAPTTNAPTDEITAAEEYKEVLLNAVKEMFNDEDTCVDYLTDEDIDAIQQLAVWYFSNSSSVYKVTRNATTGLFNFSFDVNSVAGDKNSTYLSLADVMTDGWERQTACSYFLTYLINKAESMSNYDVTTVQSGPYELATLEPTIDRQTSEYIIGPFKINKTSDSTGILQGEFKNGNNTITPIMQNQDGTVIYNSLEETVGKEFYIKIPTTTQLDDITFTMSSNYYNTTVTYWAEENSPSNSQPVVIVERKKEPYSASVGCRVFDLALRKFISSINGVAPTISREPVITPETIADLKDGKITTAVKTHPKNALKVQTGDKVVYTIRVYNEGKIDAYAKQITDYLPIGLQLVTDSTINSDNGWTNPSGDGKTIVTDKLAGTILQAFNGTDIKYLDVQVECEVIANAENYTTNLLKNVAEISIHSDNTGDTTIVDRDSQPNNVNVAGYGTTSQQDDDDFEQLELDIKLLDLSLRKFITKVNNTTLTGSKSREPVVTVDPLLNGGTTAIYNHSKTPLNVKAGDEVIYTIRVYNEGEVDGYADEITDYLPQWLEFVNDTFNAQYGWTVSANGRVVKTTITSKNTTYSASRDTIYAQRKADSDKVILKAFDAATKKLDYIDVQIKCKVIDTIITQKITNIAEITKASDINGIAVKDRDSTVNNLTLPSDTVLPSYKDTEIERGDKYIPGQEDDDDFEKIIIQKFDLALRKFITAVNNNAITNRVPIFSKDSNGKYTYTHPKTPVEVANNDIVIYTIRVYNEGNQSGYAEEIKDDLPEGLEYLPDNTINKEYRWKMYKADGSETTNPSEAKSIRTDYLSKTQETATSRNNLIKAFNTQTMTQPDYKDVKIAFKVTEPNTSDRILINTAEISDDRDEEGKQVDDIDSTPDNDKDGEDDIDIEKVRVKYFDLALEKIITEYSMKLDGKTTVTKTGHKFGVLPEPVVKIEVGNHIIKTSVLKFTYQIKVTNEGEIAGYATEIKDYIPTGLKFIAADNPKWTLSSDGKTVTTDQLKDTLLKPGDSAIIDITLQWINGQTNLGLKQNWAEISKDDNDSDSPDIDSTPDNFVKEEDDIDDASVILSVKTGSPQGYIAITGSVLAIIVSGVVVIKKFVI